LIQLIFASGAGKATKVALVACLHKVLTILNAMLKNGTDWHLPQQPTAHPSVQPAGLA
jgi:transposase